MKVRDVALCLVGGTVLYVSMAACAGPRAGSNAARGTTSGGGGVTVRDGVGGGGSGGIGGSITDPVPPANAEPAPGSRLKPRYRLGDDGAKEFLAGSWWDAQRGEECSFGPAADGKIRCLPAATDFRYYADASCTTPMVLLQGACTPPKYGLSTTDAACGLDPGASHIYSIGAATTPAMIYGKSGASCFAIGPASSDYQYYTVGAEVPASSFVASTIGHD